MVKVNVPYAEIHTITSASQLFRMKRPPKTAIFVKLTAGPTCYLNFEGNATTDDIELTDAFPRLVLDVEDLEKVRFEKFFGLSSGADITLKIFVIPLDPSEVTL